MLENMYVSRRIQDIMQRERVHGNQRDKTFIFRRRRDAVAIRYRLDPEDEGRSGKKGQDQEEGKKDDEEK
jgi:hypothetical protein